MTKLVNFLVEEKSPYRYSAVARGRFLSANKTPIVSVDLIGEMNQVILK